MTRRRAAWGPFGRQPVPTWALWARLPLQAVLVAWAWRFTRDPWCSLARSYLSVK